MIISKPSETLGQVMCDTELASFVLLYCLLCSIDNDTVQKEVLQKKNLILFVCVKDVILAHYLSLNYLWLFLSPCALQRNRIVSSFSAKYIQKRFEHINSQSTFRGKK